MITYKVMNISKIICQPMKRQFEQTTNVIGEANIIDRDNEV